MACVLRALRDGYFSKRFLMLSFGLCGSSTNAGCIRTLIPYSTTFRRSFYEQRLDPKTVERSQPLRITGVRLFSSGYKGAEQQKPLSAWTKEEVQRWFRENIDFAEHASKFRGLSGKALASLSKEDLQQALGDLQGSALYNQLHAIKDIETLFEQVYEKNQALDFKGPRADLSSITRLEFEFKDREDAVKQLTEATCFDFLSFLMRSQHKKDWGLLAITRGSGMGKTRLAITMRGLVRAELENNPQRYLSYIDQQVKNRATSSLPGAPEIYKMLVDNLAEENTFTAYVDLSNGDYFSDWSVQETMASSFLFSLACKVFFPKIRVAIIRSQITGAELAQHFNAASVASALQRLWASRGLGTVTIIANIDEFQKKVSSEDMELLKNKGDKDRLLVRQMAMTIMSVCQMLADCNVHVIPIFTGTLSLQYVGIFPATYYTLFNIPLGPLSKEASIEIVRSALRNNAIPASLINTMGGIARGLEYLVAAVRAQPDPSKWNATEVFETAVGLIKERYGITNTSLSANGLRMLVRLCLSGREVTEAEEIDGIPLATLEKDGVLFLRPSGGVSTVVMPLAFAAAFNQQLRIFDPNFVTYRPIVGSQGLEKFGAEFEVFENNLLVDLGITTTTFGDRFSGALMARSLKSKTINLSKMNIYTSKHEKLTGTLVEVMERDTPVDLEKECATIRIGRNCTVCDTITSYPNQEGGKTFIRLEECKSSIVYQRASSAGVTPGEVKQEQKNALEPARVLFPSTRFEVFFHFLSNTDLPTSHETLEECILSDKRTMITCKAQFEDRFSVMFSCIALGDETLRIMTQNS